MLKSFDKTQGNFFEKNGLSVGLLFSHHFNMLNLSFYTSYSHLNSSFGHGKRLNFNTFTLKYRFNHIFVLGASKRVFREKNFSFFLKGNVNYRIGYEIYRLASRISTEPASNQLRFNDFGIGLGIEIDYYLNKNFSIGFSTDYKYFLFKEYELSYPTYWPVNLFYNPSIVFFSLSASYTFYKKQKPEYFDNK